MRKQMIMILITAAAMLIGASASRQAAQSAGVTPWCPPFCLK